ncbi:MAG: transglutaminase family protein [Aquabacterium sp.]|uniref:transglutaminase-like domain-containing protein n=1 Tax=Aquabacterium sp. TaxID=1872578 RepID=UPI0012098035|nr:transglutaminase family protein [Aquabacterium sp.]TAK90105.1 MAG: transglutaminase family protein [Aquabacterium sp.]
MQAYLTHSIYIDFDHPAVADQAAALAQEVRASGGTTLDLVRRCFEFVRDQIRHSGDHNSNPVTIKASDVLLHQTGYCYAKSHLLAALLRANGIPAGLCYQRLSVGDRGAPYCLHGLNAVYLPEFGWYRIDARGNKPGVNAQFTPAHEALAFALQDDQERDLPEIWAEPLPIVTQALQAYDDVMDVARNLPDLILLPLPMKS